MKGKTFLILLVAAAVLGALAFLRFSDRQQIGDSHMGQKFFAALPVNAVASITLADAENRVTLVKGDKTWQVQDRGGYPADFGQLREMVVKLSRLKIGRSFTGSAESLTRLSLLAPSAEEEKGRGTQMTLKDSSGKILADLILGQTRQTEGGGSGGQYLKKTDDDTVFLVDGSFRFLKTAPADWLQDEILDIKADDVQSVTCFTGSGPEPVYTLARSEKGKVPELSPVPEGRTVDSAKVDQVFDALAPLTLDDVARADKNQDVEDAAAKRLVYRLYDGRQITLFPESGDQDNYRVRVTAEEIAGEAADAETAVSENDAETQDKMSDAEAKDKEQGTDAPAVKTAQQINEELSPWVFSVKKWQFDGFITQPQSLLEAIGKEANGAS